MYKSLSTHSLSLLFLPMTMMAATTVSAQEVTDATAEFPQRTNIATLYINVADNRTPVDKENYLPCTVRLVENGKMTTYVIAKNGIRGRGNSTWYNADKKPWRLKFDSKVEFLGSSHANAKSWTLLANAFDKTLIRNALTNRMGEYMNTVPSALLGGKMPATFYYSYKFVDLVLNGSYRGTYQISDQMEVNKKRININEDTDWLLEYGQDSGKVDEPKFALTNGTKNFGEVEVKNPEFENDDMYSNAELRSRIVAYMTDVCRKLTTGTRGDVTNYDYQNPRTGWRSKVNMADLAEWYIATEMTKNIDGLYSVYMTYQSADDMIHFGPLWDNDLSYDNSAAFKTGNQAAVSPGLLAFYTNDRVFSEIVSHFFDDAYFTYAVWNRMEELYAQGFKEAMPHFVEELNDEVKESAELNFMKWNVNDRSYDVYWFVNVLSNGSTREDYLKILRDFAATRVDRLRKELTARMNNVQYISEDIANAPVAGRDQRVVLKRDAKAGEWTTICLPFDISKGRIDYVFGEGTEVAELTAVEEDGSSMVLKFTKVNDIDAGKPYIIKAAEDVTEPFSLPYRVTYSDAPKETLINGVSFLGSYVPAGNVKALSASIRLPENTDVRYVVGNDGITLSVSSPYAGRKQAGLHGTYTLAGQKLGDGQPLKKGVYIKDGKKIVF